MITVRWLSLTLLWLLAVALAQPTLEVAPLTVAPGDTITLSGSGLPPEAQAIIALTTPAGRVDLVSLEVSPEGTLNYQRVLLEAGRWRLDVRLDELRETFQIEVAPTVPVLRDEEPTPQPVAALPELRLAAGVLIAQRDGAILWRLDFPPGSGTTTSLAETPEGTFLAHGNSVLQLAVAEGRIIRRWPVAGPISALESAPEGLIITVTHADGLGERFVLSQGELNEVVRFGVQPEIFAWLRHEAAVDDPAARLAIDPTNPWLHLAVGQQATDPDRANLAFVRAIETAQTFYDLAGIARPLLQAGREALARQAMDAALRDFAQRGYDPFLLFNRELHDAYQFPLAPLRTALARNDLASASFWAEYLWLVSPRVEGGREALWRYADLLMERGQRDEAALWRERAQRDVHSLETGLLERLLLNLGLGGWSYALALLLAVLFLHLTLLFKYWIPQGVDLRKQREARGRSWPLARLLVARYYTVTEKLVVILMLAAVLALFALANWAAHAALPAALGSGTLASAQAQSALQGLRLTEARANFIHGYSAQVMGRHDLARQRYQAAGNYPPALNNLAVLSGDLSFFRLALEAAPDFAVTRFNLGEPVPGFDFYQRYLPGHRVLAVPGPQDFLVARAGTWSQALASVFTNPWASLREATPPGLGLTAWTVLYVLFLLLAAVSLLWLFVPRARSARNAPRSPLYHLLALLIPGSGLADEAWGVLLIVPWALVGLDLLANLFGWGFDLGLTQFWSLIVLGVIYLLNLIAFIIEFASYRRRMAQRRRQEQAISDSLGV
ncbi:MAG: hypothetical protein KGZ60_09225 [Truepera sp.]|nr:hypothetical protein [Truepera sp.]